jgi:glycosyltransferase involved in cell wall biosynthesis
VKTFGLHIIARNSEETLARTLEGVKGLFDQIVVVDTGSEDNTISLAKSYGAEVYEFTWIDDFSAARNFALSKITTDWAMWLDTGDVVKPHALEQFHVLKQSQMFQSNDFDMIWVPINRKLDDHGNPLFTMIVPRIVRMKAEPIWERPIHETIVTKNPAEPRNALFDLAVVDDPYSDLVGGALRNLRILDRLIAEGDDTPRTMFYRAQELRDLGRAQEAIDQWTAFLDTNPQTWEYYDALMNIGRCYYNRNDETLQDKTNAAGVWLTAIGHDPTQPDAWFSVATLYSEIGEHAKAIVFWRACVGMVPDADGRPRNQMMYGDNPLGAIAFAYAGIGQSDKALDFFREATKMSGDRNKYKVQIDELKAHIKATKNATRTAKR